MHVRCRALRLNKLAGMLYTRKPVARHWAHGGAGYRADAILEARQHPIRDAAIRTPAFTATGLCSSQPDMSGLSQQGAAPDDNLRL
ncbi:hypothetical protein CYR40_06565 [Chimaeribacter arupi]|nr:hypothetical protein CYR40_06565 [Chimaeribacter arupi]